MIKKTSTKKKYIPNSKEKYMCAKHKKFFTEELLNWKKDIIKAKGFSVDSPIYQIGGKVISGFEQIEINDLSEGDVTVKVSHSSINYKDALAATGKGKILKKYPLDTLIYLPTPTSCCVYS